MSEVLVSEAVYSSLARTQQWIDYDPDAMEAMASALDAPLPAEEDPIYVIRDRDVRTVTVPGNQYAPSSEKPVETPVYYQGPEKRASWVVPGRKIFAVMLGGTQFDNSSLSAATAERLALPRRHRRNVIAGALGGAVMLGSLGLAVGGAMDTWPAVATGSTGYALMIWGGPKQRIPDTSNMMPPLFLRATQ